MSKKVTPEDGIAKIEIYTNKVGTMVKVFSPVDGSDSVIHGMQPVMSGRGPTQIEFAFPPKTTLREAFGGFDRQAAIAIAEMNQEAKKTLVGPDGNPLKVNLPPAP